MASYKFYLSDPKAKGETQLILRLADNLKTYKFSMGLKIEPKHWNSKTMEVRKTYNGYSTFNNMLADRKALLKRLHEKMMEDNMFDLPLLRYKFNEEIGRPNQDSDIKHFKTLAEFTAFYIETVKGTKAKGTIIKHAQTLRLLKEFEKDKRKVVSFEKVNLDFYNDFKEYLTKERVFSPNTIGKHIRNIKLFMGEATERGINKNLDYKSKRFKSISEAVESIYLTDEELHKMWEYDFSSNERLERTRDLFLIGSYTGLRFSDFSQLTADNIKEGKFYIRTQKTGDRITIPLHQLVKLVLDKYNDTTMALPKPISNQKMNSYLKEIGELVGIDEKTTRTFTKGGLKASQQYKKFELITTHTARRSFATNLYKAGFPSLSIMKITGHKTETSFMKYIKISHEENANKLLEFWQNNATLRLAK